VLAASAGEVRVNGWQSSDLGDRVEIRRRLGYLPQDLCLARNHGCGPNATWCCGSPEPIEAAAPLAR
jgi:hypothetical protein